MRHKPTCSALQRLLPDNRVEFPSAAEATAQGYQPCKLCNP
ncbi:MAG: hypothetical protein FJ291_02665 [Planctomycetes bacterium]|nr:hypothetical protein [Planctomycetota bacterium]